MKKTFILFFLDADGDTNLVYEIVRGNPQSFFKIDANSGYLTTFRKLDREALHEIELEIVVFDRGTVIRKVLSLNLLTPKKRLKSFCDANHNPIHNTTIFDRKDFGFL